MSPLPVQAEREKFYHTVEKKIRHVMNNHLIPVNDPQTPPRVQHDPEETGLLTGHQIIGAGVGGAVAANGRLDGDAGVAASVGSAGARRAGTGSAGLVRRRFPRRIRRAAWEDEAGFLDGATGGGAL